MHLLRDFTKNSKNSSSKNILNFFKSLSNLEVGGNRIYDGSGTHWMQNPNEFLGFLELLRELEEKANFRIDSLLEIGFSTGITNTILAKIFQPKKIVTVDVTTPSGISASTFMANLRFKNLIYLSMNSQDSFCIETVSKFAPFDLLFIDGDHSENGSRLDFINYEKLMNKTSVIVLHDIYAGTPCEVRKTWHWICNSGNYTCLEIYDDKTMIPYGMGIVLFGFENNMLNKLKQINYVTKNIE